MPVGGANTWARGRLGADCWANGQAVTLGDTQGCRGFLRASSTTSAGARLTADGAAAGAGNAWNTPNGTAYSLRVRIFGWLPGSVASVGYTGTMRLKRGASAGTTALSNTTLTPDSDNDAVSGLVAPPIAADTTLGGLNPISGYATAGTMRWAMQVTSEVEVQ